MSRKSGLALFAAALAFFSSYAAAETVTDSTTVYFHQSRSAIDSSFCNNIGRLDSLAGRIDRLISADPAYSLSAVRVVGAASPEGSVAINRSLSQRRASEIFGYFADRCNLPDSMTRFDFVGRDWQGLRNLVEADRKLPGRTEVLNIIDRILQDGAADETASNNGLSQLKRLDGGRPYRYMYRNMFPSLRYSRIFVDYSFRRSEVSVPAPVLPEEILEIEEIEIEESPMVTTTDAGCRPFYMALKTNMLYDALALPNLGAEFYLGRGWTVGANAMYGWWSNNNRHRYWRAYGADIAVRRYFGSRAEEKPLTGHHLGLFAGAVTYDFEFGHTGYMGGKPGGNIFDRCNYMGGIEYGYSLPVGRRLNIDFSIGLGYLGGKYVKYEPCEGTNDYIWKSTHRLGWFGPVKAEISLVWLIGCDNYNRK